VGACAAGPPGGDAPGGENAPKPPGGATPTIVPLKACLGGGPAGAGGPGGGAATAGGATGGGGVVECLPGWFIMSIVPLNFGAAAPLMLNPHFVQVVAVSGFFVPQFGQNKVCLRGPGAFTALAMPTDAPLYATRKPARFSSFACVRGIRPLHTLSVPRGQIDRRSSPTTTQTSDRPGESTLRRSQQGGRVAALLFLRPPRGGFCDHLAAASPHPYADSRQNGRSSDGVDGVQELDGVHGGPRSEAKCSGMARN
jgi:hypothetical protein